MQNFPLLRDLGKVTKPIMLKRGLAATVEDLLMSAEYILSNGNREVMLCERGIRTFETYTRNTFDLSAIPVIHNRSHLPVVADPSHATGTPEFIQSEYYRVRDEIKEAFYKLYKEEILPQL